MIDQLIQLAAAGIGSLGFALLFNLRGRRLFWASLGGVISWGVYLVVMAFWPHEAGSYLLAALLLTVYAEIMARIQKAPVTVYLVAGTIPLIPGASLYRTMSYAVTGNWRMAMNNGVTTLLLAAAISGGILACMVLWNIFEMLMRKNSRS
ncbi:MAG: threonine/serine exporter family protein [Clostridia bacterium]|nr:threonine/serine exporter family protein [Clostridia bacterium]